MTFGLTGGEPNEIVGSMTRGLRKEPTQLGTMLSKSRESKLSVIGSDDPEPSRRQDNSDVRRAVSI